MADHTALYSVAEIRGIEQAALAALPPGTLMQRAGESTAELAIKLAGAPENLAKVLVFAGPGNNGGDALETAHLLAQAGLRVSVLLYGDPAKYPRDAQQALKRALNSASVFPDTSRLSELVSHDWSLAVDGLFGIGLTRPISGTMRQAVEAINGLGCPVLALDVPSGLNADTGSIVGDGGIAVQATHTITFIGNKPGLHTAFGRDYAGEVEVAALHVGPKDFPPPHAFLNNIARFAGALRRRANNSHKGSYGDVAIVGGAPGMAGAAILAARASAKCGAGRVFAGFLEHAPPYDSEQPELMCRLARELDFSSHTLAVGPGLGTSPAALDTLTRALNTTTPLVIDADALNLVAANSNLQQTVATRNGITIMTPHPLEAARLLGTSSAKIQSDRLAAARDIAGRYNAVVTLKGAGTVISRPDGTVVINTTGNPGLATAGTGDVLTGICAALLAQNWPQWEAALAATWLHGHAADLLVQQGVGPIGLTAVELIPCVRATLNQLTDKHAQHRPPR
ncbi:MAG: ADP-dependent NAD(P)H-hydrate dehydratase / NAD(P)H-hydrate epimerase [Burkholderiales bacterium]